MEISKKYDSFIYGVHCKSVGWEIFWTEEAQCGRSVLSRKRGSHKQDWQPGKRPFSEPPYLYPLEEVCEVLKKDALFRAPRLCLPRTGPHNFFSYPEAEWPFSMQFGCTRITERVSMPYTRQALEQRIPQERRYPPTRLHGVTSHKMKIRKHRE
jgi:hypothetical protein